MWSSQQQPGQQTPLHLNQSVRQQDPMWLEYPLKSEFARREYNVMHWFSKCGSQASSFPSPGNLLDMQILWLCPRPTESETLGMGPSHLCLRNLSSDLDACYSLRTFGRQLPLQALAHLHLIACGVQYWWTHGGKEGRSCVLGFPISILLPWGCSWRRKLLNKTSLVCNSILHLHGW